MRLYLVRHGQTPANVAGVLDTAPPGAGLTDLGRRQAEVLVGALADEPVAGIYASPLPRAQLTAAPLAAALGHQVCVQQGLEEVRAGDLEMRGDHEAVATFLGCLAAWMEGARDRVMPGSTDGHTFVTRYDRAVRAIAARHSPADTVVALSHGAAIRTFTALCVSGIDGPAVSERRIKNTGAVVIEGDPDRGWQLVRWAGEPLGG